MEEKSIDEFYDEAQHEAVDAKEIDSGKANQDFLEFEDTNNKTLEEKVIGAIKEVFDPEIPVNIYDLGLIYDVSITKSNDVVVLMTLTSPNCPVAGGLPVEVEEKVKTVDEVNKSKVILTFEPPWDMSLMSEEAKFELGML